MDSNHQIKQISFEDVVMADNFWDRVYEDCGIAFRDSLHCFFSRGDVWKTVKMAVYVVCLKGHLQFADADRIIRMNPGNVLIRMPGSIVSDCLVSPDFECKVLCISEQVFSSFVLSNDFLDKVMSALDNPVVEMDYNADSIRLMEAYADILKIKSKHDEQSNYRMIITRIVECLLYELFNKIPIGTESDDRTVRHGSRYVLFKRFVKMVTHDRGVLRSVNGYADRLHVSAKYLSTVCRQLSGRTAFDWINDIVKKEIGHLLQYSDLSVKEIAVRLSFPDCSFFSKYVRRHFDMTALELRESLRAQARGASKTDGLETDETGLAIET